MSEKVKNKEALQKAVAREEALLSKLDVAREDSYKAERAQP